MLLTCCASLCLFAVEMLMLVTSNFHYVERDWLHCTSYTEDHFLKKESLGPLEHLFFRIQRNLYLKESHLGLQDPPVFNPVCS